MRALTIALSIALAGCSALAQPAPPHAATHGTAYVDVNRLEAVHPLHAMLDAYAREIAALQATQAVPQLRDTRGAVRADAQHVRGGAQDAQRALDVLGRRIGTYASREDAVLQQSLAGGASSYGLIQQQMQAAYMRQSRDVQARSAASADAYRRSLDAEANTAMTSFAHGLDARAAEAYAARAQQYRERESDVEIRLAERYASRRLVLRVKLQNLKPDAQARHTLQAELDRIDTTIADTVARTRAADDSQLAAYRAQLQAQGTRDFSTTQTDIAQRARANWTLRQQVANAQGAPADALDFSARDRHAADTLGADLQNLRDYLTLHWGRDTSASATAFGDASDDIAARFAAIADADASARADAGTEILALEHKRQVLAASLRRQIEAMARHIASDRHLTLSPSHGPAGVDLTSAVRAELDRTVGR